MGAVPGENGVPIVFRSVGNPDSRSEELIELEGGYRYQFGPTASIDVAAFHGHDDHGTTVETLAPAFALTPAPHVLIDFQYDNLLHVDTRGFEVAGHWMPLSKWRLDASYSNVFFTPDLHPASSDATASSFDGNAPQHQWQLHSTTWLTPRVELDGGLFYVGRLRQLDSPAFTRADARLEFKLTDRLAAIASGQNLLQSAHAEFSPANTGLVGSLVPRSGRVQLRWQFWTT